MKKLIQSAALGAMLFCTPNNLFAQSNSYAEMDLENIQPGKVLIVGTYHFSNPGRDVFNVESDDVKAPHRQEEIARLIEGLKAFQPTHIAIEGDVDEPIFMERYNAYLNGAELNHNERQQIGFRLAKEMGHEAVYPVDYSMRLDANIDGDIYDHIGRFQDIWDKMLAVGQGRVEERNEEIKTASIPAILYRTNLPENLKASHVSYHRYFILLSENGDTVPGPKMVANWYERNLYITRNIVDLYEGPETRIAVIYGSGHSYLLSEFLSDSPFYDVVDPLDYIPQE